MGRVWKTLFNIVHVQHKPETAIPLQKTKLMVCECRQDAGATLQDLMLTADNVDGETERKKIKHCKIFRILREISM